MADKGPANDGRLRTRPIYRVSKTCNGVLCPSVGGSVIILPKPWLSSSTGRRKPPLTPPRDQ